MLFWENLSVLDGLDSRMVMILMDFLVDGRLCFLDTSLLHRFVHNGRGDLLVDGRVMMTGLGPGKSSVVRLKNR